MSGPLSRGLVAGATGTLALNAAGYLDMVLRGRPASPAPGDTVEGLLHKVGGAVPGTGEARAHRRGALGELSGTVNGLAVGVAASLARRAGVRFSGPVGATLTGAAAMALTDSVMAFSGASDPRTWRTQDWVTDASTHLAYGIGVRAALDLLEPPTGPRRRAGAGLVARSALLGVAAGSRSTLGVAGPALTAPKKLPGSVHGPSAGQRARRAGVLLATAGELTADKLPSTPSRLQPPSLALRVSSGAGGAVVLARRERADAGAPLLAGAAGAAAGSYGGAAWRRWAQGRMSGLQAGLVEDAVALALAALACRNRRRPV